MNAAARPLPAPPEAPDWTPLLAHTCAHHIFEKTARTAPDQVAIISGNRSFTYGQVEEHAEAVARFIVGREIALETPIGVYADKSPELLIAFVGILKAGCAYVPLDPLHPVERLAYMLGEMKTPLVFCAEKRHPFDAAGGIEFVDIGTLLAAPPKMLPANVHPRAITPDNLAYIIFTSGSTGRPKGAMLEHRGLVNFCYYYGTVHNYKIGERTAQLVRPGFDASMGEMAGMFFNGVTVCIPDNEVMANPARLVDFIVENKVVRAFAATPLAELLIEEEWPREGVAFRELQTGGELLRKRISKRHPFILYNVYGPTENTNISTEYLTELAEDDARVIPIGYALTNTETLILDEKLQPVARGEIGELFLGGVQVARGYLNRPDLTAEKFIPHPFSKTPGARLYRSGDLARFREDGAVEFCGRIDFQVKIRGNRIELGEIETALNACAGVRQAVVVPVMKDGKAESLAAYWVSDEGVPPTDVELSTALKRLLPVSMVPSHFVRMDKLPLNPNGKIDRKALPALQAQASESSALRNGTALEAVAPRDELDRKLLDIFRGILNEPKLGVTHRFVHSGGTSLSALRIVSRIRRDLQKDVPVGLIFSTGTVEKLAQAMRDPAAAQHKKNDILITIQEGKSGVPPLFGIHGFGGHIFQFYLLAKFLSPDRPVYALRGSGVEPGETPDATCAAMAERYLKYILPVAGEHPVHLAGYSLGGLVSLEIAQRLRAMNKKVGVVGVIDSYAPGYPRVLPFKQRLKIHLQTIVGAEWKRKKTYIAKRINNINERIHFAFGMPYIHPEERRETDAIIPVPVFWAHRDACNKYPYRRFDGEITLLRAATPPDWPGNVFDDPAMGWAPYAGSIVSREIPGDHFTIIQEPNISTLAGAFTERMAAVESR